MSSPAPLLACLATIAWASEPVGWTPGLVIEARSVATLEVTTTGQPSRRAQGVTTFTVEVRAAEGDSLDLLIRDVALSSQQGDPQLLARWQADAAWTQHLGGLRIAADGSFVSALDASAAAAAVASAYPDLPALADSATATAVAEQLWSSLGGLAASVAARGEGEWELPGRLPMVVEGGSVPAILNLSRQTSQPCGTGAVAECVLVRQDLVANAAVAIPLLEAQVGMEITAFAKTGHVEQLVGPDTVPLHTTSSSRTEITLTNGATAMTQTETQAVEVTFTRVE